MILFLIVALRNDRTTLFIYGLALIAGKKENFKDICSITFFTNLICIIVIVLFSLIGILDLQIVNHEGQKAYNFGFAYYSTLSFYVLFLSVLGYYLFCNVKNKINIFYTCVIIGVTNYITYRLVTVRLTFICSILLVLLILLYDGYNFKNNSRINYYISLCMYPSMLILSILLPFFFQMNELGIKLDQLLNGRLYLGKMAFERYIPKLFGNLIITNNEANHYFYIDSGYIYLILGFGIILTVLVLSAYTLIGLKASEQKNSKILVWCIIVCIFSFVNNPLMDLAMNPLLFLGIPRFIQFLHNKKILRRGRLA